MDRWEDFAAFGDLGELEHVCGLLEEQAGAAEFITAEHCMTGDDSFLVARLNRQASKTMEILEAVRPGLFERSWHGKLFAELFVLLDEVTERPSRLPDLIDILCLDLHKVMIAAHDVFDPVHRAALVERAKADDFSSRQTRAAKDFPRNRKPSAVTRKALVEVVRSQSKRRIWNSAWEWLKAATNEGQTIGEFELQRCTAETIAYRVRGRDADIKEVTFRDYWNSDAKKAGS